MRERVPMMKRSNMRGGDQFVDPSYCLPLVVVVSGLPSTHLIYMKKGGLKPPLCHLLKCPIVVVSALTLEIDS